MNLISWVLVVLLAAYCVFVLVRQIKKVKNGKGCGCGCGDCPMKEKCMSDKDGK